MFTWTSFPCSRSRTLNRAIDHPQATIGEGQQYERAAGPCLKTPRQTSEYTVTGLPWSLLGHLSAWLPVVTSHSLILSSELPEASVLPSGLKATEVT